MNLSLEDVKEALKTLASEKERAMAQANFICGKINAFEEILTLLEEPDLASPPEKGSRGKTKSKEDGN